MRHKLGVLGLGVGLAGIFLYPISRGGETRLTFIAVGQGDCMVLQHRGQTMVIDVGPASLEFDAGRRLVVPELKRLGVRRIDLLVLSHDDSDHVGGLGSVASAFPIGRAVAGQEVLSNSTVGTALGGVAKTPLNSPVTVKVGGALVMIRSGPGGTDNDSSAMTLIEVEEIRILACGDGSSAYEEALLESVTGPVTIFKANHHGSNGSNSTRWLDKIRPSDIVITSGRTNSYGHPGELALSRIEDTGAKVWRTDRDGSVHFALRQGRWIRTD